MTAAHVIGVVGGSGGVGATVLAAALATRAAATGRTVACVDGDVLGGGLDVTFGLEQEPGLRWPDLAAALGRGSMAPSCSAGCRPPTGWQSCPSTAPDRASRPTRRARRCCAR
ncbi:MAG: P-loop NTPase [Oryzihumus sp.]